MLVRIIIGILILFKFLFLVLNIRLLMGLIVIIVLMCLFVRLGVIFVIKLVVWYCNNMDKFKINLGFLDW